MRTILSRYREMAIFRFIFPKKTVKADRSTRPNKATLAHDRYGKPKSGTPSQIARSKQSGSNFHLGFNNRVHCFCIVAKVLTHNHYQVHPL